MGSAATGYAIGRLSAPSSHSRVIAVMVSSSAVAGRFSPRSSIMVWFEPENLLWSPHPDLNRRPRSYQGFRSQRCGTYQNTASETHHIMVWCVAPQLGRNGPRRSDSLPAMTFGPPSEATP